MEPRLPPALAAEDLHRKKYPPGWARPCPDLAEFGQALCSPVHRGCFRRLPDGRNGLPSSQAVPLRRIYRCTAPVFFAGVPGTQPPDPAIFRPAVSPHQQRVRSGALPAVGRQNPFMCGEGSGGCDRALLKGRCFPNIWPYFSDPCLWKRPSGRIVFLSAAFQKAPAQTALLTG